MSWMSQLYRTYENNVGRGGPAGEQMIPVAHMNANAQLEITLNLSGEFQGAVCVARENAVTLIPVTEASEGRSSGIAPHALCDTLSYVAGDFGSYCAEEKQRKTAENKFHSYMKNLQDWRSSAFSHPKICAVYAYLMKKELIADLYRAGIVELNEERTFENRKISGLPYEKALVRFRINGSEPAAAWEDVSLIQAYTAYYQSVQQGKKDVCYFTGREAVIAENHPKGIIAANYGAKLVSANDSQGYTYRGRFQDAPQAFTLSYEASQKIHRALTYLAKKQGAYVGTKDKRTFLCWSPEGKRTPDLFQEFSRTASDVMDEFDLEEDEMQRADEIPYRRKLIRAFQGYRDQFEGMDSIIVMALDAATTGRLSVTYYSELPAQIFLDRLQFWGETCSWYFLRFNENKKPYYAVETPTFRRIAECAYGRERGNSLEADDRVLKEQVQRLVECMVDGRRIPYDLVCALTARASLPLAYSRGNRERVLSTACAVIAKYYREKETEKRGEGITMKLDEKNRDRSYLFGRLLAVYEKVERSTYDREETRETNAIRLQSAFVNHPLQTCMTLEEMMNPYFQKLKPGLRDYYKNQIGDIFAALQEEDGNLLNQGLKETYLLGYYLQRAELNKKKEAKKEENENE